MNYQEAMEVALCIALDSPDPSTQNGAVLLVDRFDIYTQACNEFPAGVQYTEERWERPLKYSFIEHAERNAIFKAAKLGLPTIGTTLVCPWAACADCARAIVCTGVETLVRLTFPMDASGERWRASCEAGDIILTEGGIKIVELNNADFTCEPIRRDGKLWTPIGFVE